MSDNIKVIVEREDMVAIADSIRAKTGTTAQMNMGELKTAVDGIATATAPTISVSNGGLITATAGDKSTTKQLSTQEKKTITPTTSSQTAVASGKYTTGAITVGAIPSTYVKPTATKAATTYTPATSNQTIAAGTYCSGVQTIKGDSNLVSGNIKSGVSIFGVTGSYEGSGGSSGGGIETCTVTFSDPNMITPIVRPVCVYSDGIVRADEQQIMAMFGNVQINNVLCNSEIFIYNDESFEVAVTSEDGSSYVDRFGTVCVGTSNTAVTFT